MNENMDFEQVGSDAQSLQPFVIGLLVGQLLATTLLLNKWQHFR